MKKLKVLSLFDGISCGRVALERAGFEVEKYYASEIDKYAIQIAQKNYPDTIQIGDVTKFNPYQWFDNNDKFDLLIGGSPCQGFSFAGKQLNFDDPRSALFFEFVRILKEVKPKYFLLENVRMKQEYQDIISEHLEVKPIMINSSLVSAQNRVRLYWTNIPNIEQPEDKGILLKDILEDEVDEKYYLTKSNIKTINRNFGSKGKTINLDIDNSLIEKFTYPSRIKQKKGDIKCPTLTAAMGTGGGNVPVIIKNLRIRKLTEIECERLQTLSDNYTEGISMTQRYKALGNGWTVDVISHIFKNIK